MANSDQSDLEARVAHLEMMQDLLFRLVSMTRPLTKLLEEFGATRSQEEALVQFLDGLVERSRGPEGDRPSFAYFEMNVANILPRLRGNREFLQLLMDTLRVERPAYRELHEYVTARGWRASDEA
ncbi:MAG TPA: hypothetical protein VEK15_20420 [Vicinamibacteria bacterium]|nr:hypothetical protein [Vicinamibacteria bacterium]